MNMFNHSLCTDGSEDFSADLTKDGLSHSTFTHVQGFIVLLLTEDCSCYSGFSCFLRRVAQWCHALVIQGSHPPSAGWSNGAMHWLFRVLMLPPQGGPMVPCTGYSGFSCSLRRMTQWCHALVIQGSHAPSAGWPNGAMHWLFRVLMLPPQGGPMVPCTGYSGFSCSLHRVTQWCHALVIQGSRAPSAGWPNGAMHWLFRVLMLPPQGGPMVPSLVIQGSRALSVGWSNDIVHQLLRALIHRTQDSPLVHCASYA